METNLKPAKAPVLNEDEDSGQIGDGTFAPDGRRYALSGRSTAFGGLVLLTLVLSGVFCFLLCEMATLRLETERLRIRVRMVELHVERCNALLRDGGADGGWFSHAKGSPIQRSAARKSDAVDPEEGQRVASASILSPPSSASLSSSSSSSSSSLLVMSSSSTSSASPWRRKRSTANKKNQNKEKQKDKKGFAFGFETERPVACKMSNCLSLTGWKPSSWVDTAYHRYYNDINGKLEIQTVGLYYVYGQVTYETVSALEAFAIMVDNEEMARCMTGVDYVNPALNVAENTQRKTCHTGLAVHLRKSQKVWLKSLHMEGEPISVMSTKHTSFWGVARLSAK